MILTCPAPDELSALLIGQLAPATLAQIEEHLPTCTSCLDRLNQLSNHPELEEWIGKPVTRPHAFAFLSPATQPNELGKIDRYRVLSEIGRGGMGIVFRAFDEQLQRSVALKVLRGGRDEPRDVERFHREARAASQVAHDHLVPIWDVITTHDGRPVLVMPLIVGPTLRNSLSRSSRSSAMILSQIASALSTLHSAGLIHRDIKSSNILLDEVDGRAKLTDFGLIRDDAKQHTLTQDGMIVGTPEYVSPEQATTPNSVDARSDVYSLGITMYECLTGVVPFRGPLLDVLEKQRHEEPIPVRHLNSAIPVDLETICLKCLKKRPDQRYASAKALQDDLDRWLTNQPILARPTGRMERSLLWCRRNPWPVALTAVALIGSIVSGIGWWEANLQTGKAHAATREAAEQTLKAQAATDVALGNLRLSNELSNQALNSINTLITKAQNTIGNAPGTLGLKKQLNEAALQDLSKLSRTVQDLPGIERSTISAHLKLGDTFYALGQTDAAMANWRQAIQRSESRLAENPSEMDTQRDLARAHDSLSQALAQLMNFPAAIEHNQYAIDILQKLSTGITPNISTVRNLALAFGNRGRIALWQQQPFVALTALNKSVEFWKLAMQLDPDEESQLADFFVTIGRIGYVHLFNRHDYESAERVFREQYDLAQSQVKKNPKSITWLRNHRLTSLDLASALQRLGRWKESQALVKSVLSALITIAANDPDNTLLQRECAAAYSHLGDAQMMGKEFRDSQESYTQSLKIIETISAQSGGVSQYSSDVFSLTHALSVTAFRLGDFEGSAKWLERHGAITLELYGKTMSATERDIAILTNQGLAKSLRYLTASMQDPNTMAKFSLEMQKAIHYFHAWKRVCDGELVDAEKLLKTTQLKFARDPFWIHVEAFWHGAMATRCKNPDDRQAHILRGSEALIASQKANPYMLSTMYLHPELLHISKSPEYRKKLLDILDK